VGLSESSIRRWVDSGVIRASKTAGGHRRISVTEALNLIRDRGLRVVRPDLLDLDADGLAAADSPDRVSDQFYRLLSEGRPSLACAFLSSLFVRGWSAADICDGPLRESMRRVGEVREDDGTAIFVEHRATEICIRALVHLSGYIDARDDAPVAVGGALTGDPFQIPTLMAAVVLGAEGFQSINVGADTPISALRAAVEHHRPVVVWLSMGISSIPLTVVSEVSAFAAELGRDGISMIVGGRGVASCRSALPPSVHQASTMRELAAFAHGLRAATGRAGDSQHGVDESGTR
jgi:methanogenic corrinoid protein MtbC1